MSVMTGYQEFEDFLAMLGGNRYLATMLIAKEGRRRCKQWDYSILDSNAITWVLTGKRPPNKEKQSAKILRNMKKPSDILNYVEDDDIRKCVILSLKQSYTLNHLTYSYNQDMNKHKRTRVRILTNIIWYKNHEEEE